ncbi:MAG: pilus assembly protein [Gammaproteobacteria bacterium]
MKRKQQGLATVEFAIVGALFLLVMLAVLEFSRLVFVWSSATEATRRGVRVAVVCPINDPAISNVTVFNDDAVSGPSALLPGLSTANVAIDYLDAGGNPLACTGCNCDDTCGDPPFVSIKYVQVSINNYQHSLLLPPPFNVMLTLPAFTSTLPRESLGVVPGTGTLCTFS